MAHDEGEEAAEKANVEVAMDEAILHDALRQALGDLPEAYAMLFSLHYEEELTVPQVAQITSLPRAPLNRDYTRP